MQWGLLWYVLDIDSQTVTITSNAGTPVSGSATTTYDYRILSSVTLTCNVTPSSFTVDSYRWGTTGCYTNSKFTNGNPQCFPHNQMTQSVTENNLNAEDAGTITCHATINGVEFDSEPFTLRISGEQLVYCVIACIVYCKQCMLLLLATCYCCIIHQLLWFMYRGVFTVGVAVTDATQNTNLNSANELTDYSYINARIFIGISALLARCLIGLGPTVTSNGANGPLGGLYFNGNMIPNSGEQASCSSDVIQVRPGGTLAGVMNFHQCQTFTTDNEGVYTCTMMNSSMMDESVRFGIYRSTRSESLHLYNYIPSLNHLSSLYTAAPMIDTPSSSTVTVNVGDTLILSCTSRRSPPDTFTWRKDSGPVLQSITTPVTYNANSAVFRADYSIDSVTTSDSRTYTCTVTNPIGSDSTTITVVVIGKLLCNLWLYYKIYIYGKVRTYVLESDLCAQNYKWRYY